MRDVSNISDNLKPLPEQDSANIKEEVTRTIFSFPAPIKSSSQASISQRVLQRKMMDQSESLPKRNIFGTSAFLPLS